jgi:carbonic anhydrase
MGKRKEIGLALSCIDYRLFDKTLELLKEQCCVDKFDHCILAGSSLGYNQNKYECWPPTFIEHVDLAIKLHHIKKIVVIDHEDCGAYKLFYPHVKHHPELERKLHIKNIKKFIKRLKQKYPQLLFAGYLLALDGTAERIHKDKF